MLRIEGKYQFGPFHLDAAEHRLSHDGMDVPLQRKAFEILCILVRNAGRLLSKETLIRQAWPDMAVEENNLNKNICLLRKVLGERGKGPSYIETVPRVGYRFTAEVTKVEGDAPAKVTGSHDLKHPPEKSVAVLYFENLSGDKGDEYFRDGMTEDVITELAKIKGLRLLPRTSMLAFRDTPLTVTEAGRQLRAAFVLEGSIRRAGSQLRITARLAETSTGHSVWAERYDRRVEDVFAIHDEIAQNIARALRVVLTEQEKREIEKIPTSDIQAYDYYLRGRQYFYQYRRPGLELARQMFAQAIAIDPDYARAYAGLADCCSFLCMWSKDREDSLREALSASRRAIELDPHSAEAHASHGLAEFFSENFEASCKEFETALSLDAELFEVHYFYGRSCFAQGQFEKAARFFARAAEINPCDYQAPILRALCFRALKHDGEARAAFRTGLKKVEHHLHHHPGDVRALTMGANALCGLDENVRAREWADRALSMDPEEASVLYNVACVYALLEETGKALNCLEKALEQGFCHKGWLRNDPDLSSVRDHPRFQALVEDFEAHSFSCTA